MCCSLLGLGRLGKVLMLVLLFCGDLVYLGSDIFVFFNLFGDIIILYEISDIRYYVMCDL